MSKVKVCMVIAVSLLVCACSGGNKQEGFRRGVYLTHPTQVSGDVVKSYPGIIEAAHEINLGFKTAGQISRIHVKEGDYVRRGQLLATLDAPYYIERVATHDVKHVLAAKRAIKKALQFQAEGRGYSFVEVLVSCPTNWHMAPVDALRFMGEECTKTFPLGVYRDKSEGKI